MINNLLNISKEEIGKRILTERKAKRITIKDISEKTGMSAGSISEIERGKTFPSAQALAIFSNIFKCSVDFLLFGNVPIDSIEYKSAEEEELIKAFRIIDKYDRAELLMLADMKKEKHIKKSI